ncbi:hypothetical protein A2971_03200 [Candidatus Gottesmanbacteria bacterium RIFCSPLOWO2_01_FULL_46_21]|uniref:Methyltransferase domain-containing protein n=1 Tax=Candidatus Gottesmanbacteria bacterium RIFCSPLOWO2_01_FULL_46_21 TaxID=1798393 RepID=A0A1F6AVD8_9BACT|nr:MAG: hypothetical protein A2971_03200 [Candidatus Gottesmanbacteria bacterium RIFCSPLOWO2_01_FULL_46_21]
MNQSNEALIKKHVYFNQRFFARWARVYDYEKYILFPIRNKAASLLNLPANSRILDVATGTGAQAYSLAKRDYDVIGIDLSQEMLEQAKKKLAKGLKLKFIHGDATKLPFKDNTFDACSISLALHDMPYEIRFLVLKEMMRVTKSDGKILIVDYLEPHKNYIARLTCMVASLFETPMWKNFIDRGLLSHLNISGLKPEMYATSLNVSQIVICPNKKS